MVVICTVSQAVAAAAHEQDVSMASVPSQVRAPPWARSLPPSPLGQVMCEQPPFFSTGTPHLLHQPTRASQRHHIHDGQLRDHEANRSSLCGREWVGG